MIASHPTLSSFVMRRFYPRKGLAACFLERILIFTYKIDVRIILKSIRKLLQCHGQKMQTNSKI